MFRCHRRLNITAQFSPSSILSYLCLESIRCVVMCWFPQVNCPEIYLFFFFKTNDKKHLPGSQEKSESLDFQGDRAGNKLEYRRVEKRQEFWFVCPGWRVYNLLFSCLLRQESASSISSLSLICRLWVSTIGKWLTTCLRLKLIT